jgi:hypothetical protein
MDGSSKFTVIIARAICAVQNHSSTDRLIHIMGPGPGPVRDLDRGPTCRTGTLPWVTWSVCVTCGHDYITPFENRL